MPTRVFGFAGWSGSGKTTLIEQVIPCLVARGLTVSLVKHAHHAFDVDYPGKDSYRHREAGCSEVLVTSSRRWALVHELRGAPELTLAETLERLSPCDLVLIEGYKRSRLPKLEIHRGARQALASSARPPHRRDRLRHPSGASAGTRPIFRLDDCDTIATFVTANARVARPDD